MAPNQAWALHPEVVPALCATAAIMMAAAWIQRGRTRRYTSGPTAPKRRTTYQQSVPGETQSSSGGEIDVRTLRRFKHQLVTTGPTKARENQMAKGKHMNTNTNQGNMAASEPSSLTAVSPGYPNTPGIQGFHLKSLVRMLIVEHIDRSLKEIQEKKDQKLEALTRQTQKSPKGIQENMDQKIEANKEELQKPFKEL